MPIVFCSLDIYLPHCHSLKEKRNVLRKAMERVRSRSGFSIAEIDHQDLWQRARVGAVSIGPDSRRLESLSEKMVRDIELAVGHEVHCEIEMIDYD